MKYLFHHPAAFYRTQTGMMTVIKKLNIGILLKQTVEFLINLGYFILLLENLGKIETYEP